jgi:hypothetical protein
MVKIISQIHADVLGVAVKCRTIQPTETTRGFAIPDVTRIFYPPTIQHFPSGDERYDVFNSLIAERDGEAQLVEEKYYKLWGIEAGDMGVERRDAGLDDVSLAWTNILPS